MTKWKIVFTTSTLKEISKLDKKVQLTIQQFFKEKIERSENPKIYGKPLRGTLKNIFSYRVGSYRILTEFKNGEFLIIVIKVGHRKNVCIPK
tara:strand:+ start:1317 stop:1592 length:276 start_codon:yes stop_codon:yes gene_type:complete